MEPTLWNFLIENHCTLLAWSVGLFVVAAISSAASVAWTGAKGEKLSLETLVYGALAVPTVFLPILVICSFSDDIREWRKNWTGYCATIFGCAYVAVLAVALCSSNSDLVEFWKRKNDAGAAWVSDNPRGSHGRWVKLPPGPLVEWVDETK